MGFGDEILGSGLAKGAHARGKRIAFGDGRSILWAATGALVYKNNPNIAPPGSEGCPDLEWIPHYKHHRIYFHKSTKGSNWEYDPNFRATPGEIYFSQPEQDWIRSVHPRFVLIEPCVKGVYPNKQWPFERYQTLAKALVKAGYRVTQFVYPGTRTLEGIKYIRTEHFRHALAALSRASLYIGPEGGLAHGATALGVQGVVLFGGFTDPKILGYDGNVNLTGGAQPCGSLARCQHCKESMERISMEVVYESAIGLLKKGLLKK